MRVRSRNFWGWSAFSTALQIKASTWPQQVLAPKSELNKETGNIDLTWTAPHDGSDQISEYLVLCQQKNGDWKEVCDRKQVVESLSCSIQMETLWNDFGLLFEDLPLFTVSAYNVNGWGEVSAPNQSGQTILTKPRFMNKVQRDPATND